MATALGDAVPATYRLGDSQVSALALGDSTFWQSFSPMGMNKAANQVVAAGQTVLIQGWTERPGYPGTEIVGDALVSNGPEAVTVQAKVTLTGAWVNANSLTVHVLKSGASIASATFSFNTSAKAFPPVSTTLAAGDTLALRIVTPAAAGCTVAAGTQTYLYYDKT